MLKNIIKWFYFFIKYKKNRISIAITSNVSINSTFEGFNKIHSKSKFKGHIGLCSYIGSHANLSSVHIGRFTSIAHGTEIITGIHIKLHTFQLALHLFLSWDSHQSFLQKNNK